MTTTSAHNSKETTSCPCSVIMETAHPKMIQIQKWAHENYRRGCSSKIEEMNEMRNDGNATGYMELFSPTIGRFLDPNKPQFINPNPKLMPIIEEITKLNNDYLEEVKETRRKERLIRKSAKQRSRSTLIRSNTGVVCHGEQGPAISKDAMEKVSKENHRQKQKSERFLGARRVSKTSELKQGSLLPMLVGHDRDHPQQELPQVRTAVNAKRLVKRRLSTRTVEPQPMAKRNPLPYWKKTKAVSENTMMQRRCCDEAIAA